MTHELRIAGEPVDLSGSVGITLEYVSNILGQPGKIDLSRSYTIKLPKTRRNAMILDDPGNPGHNSSGVRRFFSARYYRNGIDLIGDAQAYVLRSTSEGYEVALVWNTLEALQALSQSTDTINQLKGLPVLTWIGLNGETPDYQGVTAGSREGGAMFAWYESGLGAKHYPEINTGTHPCISLGTLFDKVLTQAGVPYSVDSADVRDRLDAMLLLAAPGHKPSRAMEEASGFQASRATIAQVNNGASTTMLFDDFTGGWDSPEFGKYGQNSFATDDHSDHHITVNLRTPAGVDFSSVKLVVSAFASENNVMTRREIIATRYFVKDGDTWVGQIDEDFSFSGWPNYSINIMGYVGESFGFQAVSQDIPLLSVYRVHETIQISFDNRFPIEGNLPDIKQWDFLMSCLALCGAVPVIRAGALHIVSYADAFDPAEAYDWTAKVSMVGRQAAETLSYSLDGWARHNLVAFQRDANDMLSFNPDADLAVDDTTIAESRDFYALPYAASFQSSAPHYRINDQGEVEDVDIEPRVFLSRIGVTEDGVTRNELYFPESMYGTGLLEGRYAQLMRAVRKPVVITANIRLHELDIADLDMRRCVYLAQYGRYYAIIKIQTSDKGVCKVELLQLP